MSKEKQNRQYEEKSLPAAKPAEEAAVAAVSVAKVVVPRQAAEVALPRIVFDKYVVRKGVKASHVAGMRAFAANVNIKRTFPEWEKFFEKY
jgi:hypothetical protein